MDLQIIFTGMFLQFCALIVLWKTYLYFHLLLFLLLIYSIAVNPDGSGFASVGEDSSLRVWKDGNVAQVLALPAQSVWSVTFLSNSDIVTGSRLVHY